jgi:Rgg/GadR/MutR family transcriptional activator
MEDLAKICEKTYLQPEKVHFLQLKGAFFMIYGDYVKLIRQKRNIPQSALLPKKNKSQATRIEQNKTKLTLDLLYDICTNLGISMDEFVHIVNSDTSNEELINDYRMSLEYSDKAEVKNKMLKHLSLIESKSFKDRTNLESYLLVIIRSLLSKTWEELSPPSTKEINDLYNYLISLNFYSQYEYMVLCNMAENFTIPQLNNLVKKTYPIYLNQKRNHQTKWYASLFMLNVISMCIYYQEYTKGLKYVDLMKRHSNRHKDYYSQLNLVYLENILLSFSTNESKYITKAYSIIQIIKDIGDTNAAEMLEKELDTLVKNPAAFKNNKSWDTILIQNFD